MSHSVVHMFDPPKRCEKRGCGQRHHHQDDWDSYWKTLTEGQRQSLRDKARWEQMTLSAVAMSWGALG